VVDITRPDEAALADLSHRTRLRRPGAVAAERSDTFLGTALKTERTSMPVRRHLSSTSRYGVTYAGGMAISPETAPTSRATVVANTEAVFTENTEAIIKRVKDVTQRTEESAST